MKTYDGVFSDMLPKLPSTYKPKEYPELKFILVKSVGGEWKKYIADPKITPEDTDKEEA